MSITEKEVVSIVANALKVSVNNINIDSKMGDFEEWDSLGQLSILSKLDEELDGKAAKIRELSESFSIKKIIESLKKNKLIKD